MSNTPSRPIDGPVHWFIGPWGMRIYRGGQMVAVVPVSAFAGVIADMAGVLASNVTAPKQPVLRPPLPPQD
jgi:hypothetical protein